MNTGTAYDAQAFGAFLSKPQAFVIDLRNSSLIECIEKYIEVYSMKRPAIRRTYQTLLSKLRALEFLYHCTLRTEQITDVFWIHFQKYLTEDNGIKMSSAKTLCANLRSAIVWSSKHNAIVSPTFDLVEIGDTKTEQVALTTDEISHIYHFDLSCVKRKDRRDRLDRTRDALVLSCQLGCRHSDLVRIGPENFDRNKFKILQKKTGTYAYVDIDKLSTHRRIAYTILEKYNYRFPFVEDISKYNKNIHELLRLIGDEFNDDVVIEEKVNGVIKEYRLPKYKMISSHTGRRSFVTNNVLRGINITEIKKGSGHKSLRSFEGYICEDMDLIM